MKAREIVAWVGFALALAAAGLCARASLVRMDRVIRLEHDLHMQRLLCSGLSDEEQEIVKNLRAAKAAQEALDNADRWRAPPTP